MQDVKTHCPLCHKELDVPVEWNGVCVECPFCKKEFVVRLSSDSKASTHHDLNSSTFVSQNQRQGIGFRPASASLEKQENQGIEEKTERVKASLFSTVIERTAEFGVLCLLFLFSFSAGRCFLGESRFFSGDNVLFGTSLVIAIACLVFSIKMLCTLTKEENAQGFPIIHSNTKFNGIWTILCCGFILLYGLYDWISLPSVKKIANIAKNEYFNNVFKDKAFFYYGSEVKSLALKKTGKKGVLEGIIVFTRNQKDYKRPLRLTYLLHDKKYQFAYFMDVDYAKTPAYLLEDADLIFDQLMSTDDLKGKSYRLVGTSTLQPMEIRFKITDGKTESDLDIRVKRCGSQSGWRYSYELIDWSAVEYQYAKALRYETGSDVPVNKEKAFEIYQTLAKKDFSLAQVKLCQYYKEGIAVQKDLDIAMYWAEKAGEHGCEEVQAYLLNTFNEKKDWNKYCMWSRKYAEKGNAWGQRCYALCYENGWGIRKNEFKAFFWMMKSAEQGEPLSQRVLARYYRKGIGTSVSFVKEFHWLNKSAEQGDPLSQRLLALCYFFGEGTKKNYKKAFHWMKKAAEQGQDEDAQYCLAIFYKDGIGVAKDATKAFIWMKKSAEQGDLEAMCELSSYYLRGYGVEQNRTLGFRCCRDAAEKKHAKSQYLLAKCYQAGWGTSVNEKQAFYWAKRSAENGCKEGMNLLASFLADGFGCVRDIRAARSWRRKAEINGGK